jgi:hypothetical protein
MVSKKTRKCESSNDDQKEGSAPRIRSLCLPTPPLLYHPHYNTPTTTTLPPSPPLLHHYHYTKPSSCIIAITTTIKARGWRCNSGSEEGRKQGGRKNRKGRKEKGRTQRKIEGRKEGRKERYRRKEGYKDMEGGKKE